MTALLALATVEYGEPGWPFVVLAAAFVALGGWLLATRPRK